MSKEIATPRNIGRREEDGSVRRQLDRFKLLFHVGQVLTSEMNRDVLFDVIMQETNKVLESERSTVFLYDEETDELWSLVATGLKKNEIRIRADSGVAGRVFRTQEGLIVTEAFKDPAFDSSVDRHTGFQTRNIACVPVINRGGKCIGVLEALNKANGDFSDQDLGMLLSMANYVAIALENAGLYQDVQNYSGQLKSALEKVDTLERMKSQLTKFVPTSIKKMVETDPGEIGCVKTPMPITVLFLDIQGFSRLTERHDPQLVNDMVETYFSEYLDCINRHGGEINETSGDGLMVIFKDGSTDENARRAVLTGLEIAAKTAELNRAHRYPWGETHLHLGINSGTGWVGCTRMRGLAGERYTYTASGLPTVLAARIGAMSSNTLLYVGQSTFDRIRFFCHVEALGEKKAKNVEEPVQVYWVKGLLHH